MRVILACIALLGLVGVAAATPQVVSYSNGWEQGITGNGMWNHTQIMADDRFQRVQQPVRKGQYAVRVEVRPGDDPLGSSGERAEVSILKGLDGRAIQENTQSGVQYIAFSVRLAHDWQAPEIEAGAGRWGILAQLHGPDTLIFPPAFSFQALDGYSVVFYSGDLDSTTESLRNQRFALWDATLNLGRWTDFVFRIDFAEDFTGTFDVWRRDEQELDFRHVLSLDNLPTLQYKSSEGSVGDHYWKHGFYRSKQTRVTNVLWLDGFSRATSFDEVVDAAFPTQPIVNLYLPLARR
ncbi:MAG: polysaccharide lyase [Chloroflexi bacterium]|nr:polysaccharide lyase [Chloroflexota bacterium]